LARQAQPLRSRQHGASGVVLRPIVPSASADDSSLEGKPAEKLEQHLQPFTQLQKALLPDIQSEADLNR